MIGRRGVVYAAMGAVAMLVYVVWWPWLVDIRTSRAQIDQLEQAQQQRQRSVAAQLDQLHGEVRRLEDEWQRLHAGMLASPTSAVAGTEFLRMIQQMAQETGIEIRSSGLSPIDTDGDPVWLTADIRGEGRRDSVYAFLFRISEGPPAYKIRRARLDRLPGDGRLAFEMVLSALWSPLPSPYSLTAGDGDNRFEKVVEWASTVSASPSAVSLERIRELTLFGVSPEPPLTSVAAGADTDLEATYRSDWSVVGMVQSTGGAAAILRHGDGAQRVVRVGDTIGEERVVAVEGTRVVLTRGEARAIISMSVAPVGLSEGEVGP